MATNKQSAKSAAKKTGGGKDPRGQSSTKQTGQTTQTHDHLAASAQRRRLGDDTNDESKGKRDPADDVVTVQVPRAYNLLVLTPEGSRMIRYEAGINEMPRSHAEHDYSKAHGVEIVE